MKITGAPAERAFSTNRFRQRTKKTFLFFLRLLFAELKIRIDAKSKHEFMERIEDIWQQWPFAQQTGVQPHQLLSLCACLQKFVLYQIKRSRWAIVHDATIELLCDTELQTFAFGCDFISCEGQELHNINNGTNSFASLSPSLLET